MTDDELDFALTPRPQDRDPVREAELLKLTQRQLPRPNRWPLLLSLVLVFGAGVGLGWFSKPAVIEVRTLPGEPIIEYRDPPPPQPPEPTEYVVFDPYQVELQAELAERPQAAELYRQLGDYYLDRDDIRSASRCYRLHLQQITPDQLAISDRDSWLLNPLKSIRRREQLP